LIQNYFQFQFQDNKNYYKKKLAAQTPRLEVIGELMLMGSILKFYLNKARLIFFVIKT
jgi:hypothetical protein